MTVSDVSHWNRRRAWRARAETVGVRVAGRTVGTCAIAGSDGSRKAAAKDAGG